MNKRIRTGDYIELLVGKLGYRGVFNSLACITIPAGEVVRILKTDIKNKQLHILIDNHIYWIHINSKEYKIIPKSQLADLLYYE